MKTEDRIKAAFAFNVNKLLAERNKPISWLIAEIGDTSSRLYSALRQESMPNLAVADKIAQVFGVSIDSLLTPERVYKARMELLKDD